MSKTNENILIDISKINQQLQSETTKITVQEIGDNKEKPEMLNEVEFSSPPVFLWSDKDSGAEPEEEYMFL